MDEGLAGRQRQYEGWIHNLSKELCHYKATNQELSNKLRELIGSLNQNKGERAIIAKIHCPRPHSVLIFMPSSICLHPHAVFVLTLSSSSLNLRPLPVLILKLSFSSCCPCPHPVLVLTLSSSSPFPRPHTVLYLMLSSSLSSSSGI